MRLERASEPEAWLGGRFVYDNARLGDIVADLNRYRQPGIRILDPALAEIRFTAAFRADQIDEFFAALPHLNAIAVQRRADGSLALAPKRGTDAGT
jgi:transmembrane sensor